MAQPSPLPGRHLAHPSPPSTSTPVLVAPTLTAPRPYTLNTRTPSAMSAPHTTPVPSPWTPFLPSPNSRALRQHTAHTPHQPAQLSPLEAPMSSTMNTSSTPAHTALQLPLPPRSLCLLSPKALTPSPSSAKPHPAPGRASPLPRHTPGSLIPPAPRAPSATPQAIRPTTLPPHSTSLSLTQASESRTPR